ncbi:MAG: hypothetical protein R3208_02400 [Ketobacteraceae bacterium]|nr:hypothetical protein [Ketobacteraceae bacterium]
MKNSKVLSAAGVALAVMALSGCSKLTTENYDKLETGMDKEEVLAIIGSPDKCEEALGAESCVWGDDQKNIKVKLVAGKAVFFSNKGLK